MHIVFSLPSVILKVFPLTCWTAAFWTWRIDCDINAFGCEKYKLSGILSLLSSLKNAVNVEFPSTDVNVNVLTSVWYVTLDNA